MSYKCSLCDRTFPTTRGVQNHEARTKTHKTTGQLEIEAFHKTLNKLTWQLIATIPKGEDGYPVPGEFLLLVKQRAGVPGKMLVGHWMPGGYCIEDHPAIARGWYFWNGSQFDLASEPMFWMALPEPPKP